MPPEYVNANIHNRENIGLAKKTGFDLSKPLDSEMKEEAESL